MSDHGDHGAHDSHGDHGDSAGKSSAEKIQGILKVIALVVVVIFAWRALSSYFASQEAKRRDAFRREEEILNKAVEGILDPRGETVSSVRILEVRPGRPRHHTFSRSGEIIVVRYLGEGPEYHDEASRTNPEAGVWVKWPGHAWCFDPPGPEGDHTPPWKAEGDTLFCGGAQGQTLTLNVIR
jgi:hypothetical protein